MGAWRPQTAYRRRRGWIGADRAKAIPAPREAGVQAAVAREDHPGSVLVGDGPRLGGLLVRTASPEADGS